MAMEVKLTNGKLIIEIDVNKPPVESKTGKSLVVASTNGNRPTGVLVAGKVLIVGLNAYVSK